MIWELDEEDPVGRAEMRSKCLDCAGRKNAVPDDDLERLIDAYSDEDLWLLYEIACLDTGNRRLYQFRLDVRSLILDDDLVIVRIASKHLEAIRRGRTTLRDLSLIVGALREIGAMSSEDEDNPALPAHFSVFRSVDLDRRLPYHMNDDLMLIVQEFHERLEEISRYRMDRGDDTGGLREYLNTPSRVLAEGVL